MGDVAKDVANTLLLAKKHTKKREEMTRKNGKEISKRWREPGGIMRMLLAKCVDTWMRAVCPGVSMRERRAGGTCSGTGPQASCTTRARSWPRQGFNVSLKGSVPDPKLFIFIRIRILKFSVSYPIRSALELFAGSGSGSAIQISDPERMQNNNLDKKQILFLINNVN